MRRQGHQLIVAFCFMFSCSSAHLIQKKIDENGNEIPIDTTLADIAAAAMGDGSANSLDPHDLKNLSITLAKNSVDYPVGTIYLQQKEGVGFTATGTLIAPNLVLTCGHTAEQFNPSLLDQSLQELTRAQFSIGSEYVYSGVSTYFLPKTYNPQNFQTDIGILKLRNDIHFAPDFYTYPFTIETSKATIEQNNKIYCVSGGPLRFSETAEETCIRHITQPNVFYDQTTGFFREKFTITQTCPRKRMGSIWALPDRYCGGTGIQFPFTPGDSGSPLLLLINDTTPALIGIASHVNYDSVTDQYLKNSHFYNNWLPIAPYIPWIKQIIEEHGTNGLQYHPELIEI